MHPGIQIIAHPECPSDVLEEADFFGIDSRDDPMGEDEQPRQVVMVTECSMSDNVAAESPETKIYPALNLCRI
ncbi:MAG: hypothetical protein Ct9H300mP15_29640 [Gemmatimonadota bacterium]|nr:MAG: hypothetical protein Ct9H300mP15_29640 [Gemmatimonadota bacterium]